MHQRGQPWHLPETERAAVSRQLWLCFLPEVAQWDGAHDGRTTLAQADVPTCQGMLGGLMDTMLGPLSLKVWPGAQNPQHHLGAGQRCRLSTPPRPMDSESHWNKDPR